jgi:predicted Zn-dependent protease
LALVAAWFAMSGHAVAENFFGFRLLNLDGIAVKWGDEAREPVKLTYAIVTDPMKFPASRNCGGLSPLNKLLQSSSVSRSKFDTELKAAFEKWEGVARISFVETHDIKNAKILIGAQTRPIGRAYTDVAYSRETTKTGRIDRSLICLNPNQPWKVGFDGNVGVYDLRYTLAHEIGHAIGLDHPSASGQLMSFKYDERFEGLQAGDIAGIKSLYNAQ